MQPRKICGSDAGRITDVSMAGFFTFRTFAESTVLLSTFSTPLIVPANIGQNDARKITKTETERNVGKSAIPYGIYTIGGIELKNFVRYDAAFPSLAEALKV